MANSLERFAIVGGGFGLYGYLPALIRVFGEGILLPEKYRSVIASREELTQFEGQIDWQPNLQIAIRNATGVVLAVPPVAQHALVKEILLLKNVKKILLEKPIAPTAKVASDLINDNLLKYKKYRVGYTFVYTPWFPILNKLILSDTEKVEIIWKFRAHHITSEMETWKRYHSLGGGVLRSYGIHLIAVLASLGYTDIFDNNFYGDLSDQPTDWKLRLAGKSVPECSVLVSLNSDQNEFVINSTDKFDQRSKVYSASDPFQIEGYTLEQDVRVTALQKLIESFNDDDSGYISFYQATNVLWQNIDIL